MTNALSIILTILANLPNDVALIESIFTDIEAAIAAVRTQIEANAKATSPALAAISAVATPLQTALSHTAPVVEGASQVAGLLQSNNLMPAPMLLQSNNLVPAPKG